MEYQVYFSLKIQHCRLLQSGLAPKGLIMQIYNRLHVPLTTVKLETLGDMSEKLCRLRSQC